MISALMEAALRALAMAVMVWVGLRLLRVKQVPVEKAAWALVLVAALAAPFWIRWQALSLPIAVRVPQSVVSRFPVPQSLVPVQFALQPAAKVAPQLFKQTAVVSLQAAAETGNSMAPAILKPSPAKPRPTAEPHLTLAPRSTQPQSAIQVSSAPHRQWFTLSMLAAILYLAVTAFLLTRMFVGLAGAIRLYRASEPVFLRYPPFSPAGPADGLRMRSSSAVASPVTIGSGVVLPAEYVHWDWEKLRIVLAHERAHVDQGDFYLQLLTRFYTAIFWFSPLGWWLERKLSDLGETISDRAGIEQAGSHTGYAQVLLEVATLPHPTVLGVAMARTANLSARIERLLNEPRFRQAFSGNSRRWLAVLLVLVAMLGGKAMVHVEAAAQEAPAAPAASSAPVAAPAPTAAPDPAAAPSVAEPTPEATPAEPASAIIPPPEFAPPTAVAPVPVVAPVSPPYISNASVAIAPVAPAAPAIAPVAPAHPYGEIHDAADEHTMSVYNGQDSATLSAKTMKADSHSYSKGQSYSYSHNDQESWAFVNGLSNNVNFSGDWHESTRNSIDKARKLSSGGKFLWFVRDNKSYFVDDPAVLSRIDAMYKPIEELGRQQEELGKKQEELGRQQEALGKQQEQATAPAPDMSKEIAEINQAMAKLQAKMGKNISQDELADLQGRLGDLQGKLGSIEGEIGEQQGKLGEQQGKLGEQQGRLGDLQGKLGEQQGRISEENDPKVRAIIDESLRNGKARPVE